MCQKSLRIMYHISCKAKHHELGHNFSEHDAHIIIKLVYEKIDSLIEFKDTK